MFDSKKAKWIVCGLGAWLALVEAAAGQETSATYQADEVLQQAEPVSGRTLPRAVYIDVPQPVIDDQDLFFPRLTGALPQAQIPVRPAGTNAAGIS